MAATNPFKVKDLIAKYGWQIIPYLSNLGVTLLSDSQVLFVDSGATNTLDADDTEHGHSFDMPLATIDYAIGLCTANQGDVILVAPGHTEAIIAASTLTLDVAGITVLGLGRGTLRPTLSLGTATAATINITAANCRFSGFRVISALANVAAGVTLGASANGSIIEYCDFRDGGTAVLELVIGISVAADCDDIIIRNNNFSTVPAGGCNNAIFFAGGCDRAIISDNTAYGTYATGCFLASTAASVNIIVRDNLFANENAVAIALHTGCTGLMSSNHLGGTTSMAAALTGTDLMWMCENYVSGENNKNGAIIPAIDSE